jgi:hypothetical protein
MAISELKKQLLQLSPSDKLYLIQLLAQRLNVHNSHPDRSTKLAGFFHQSPLAELTEDLRKMAVET